MLPHSVWHVIDYCKRNIRVFLLWHFSEHPHTLQLPEIHSWLHCSSDICSSQEFRCMSCHFPIFPVFCTKPMRTEYRRNDFQQSKEYALQRTQSAQVNRWINNYTKKKLMRYCRKCARVCLRSCCRNTFFPHRQEWSQQKLESVTLASNRSRQMNNII